MKRLLLLLGLCLVAGSVVLADDISISGDLSNVIVYRGQALVTRDIPAEKVGSYEIVVTDLPSAIVSDTLYADTPDGITISSVRYREKVIKEDTREEVKELERKISDINFEKYIAEKNREMAMVNWSSLDKLENYSVTSKEIDLKSGVLQADPVIQIQNYIETQRSKFRKESLEIDRQIREFEQELVELNKKLSELKQGRQTRIREAVLLVNKTGSDKGVIKLNYMVNNANWSPQYNLKAMVDNSKCMIEYNAIIHQSTGEDWEGVDLSLSTAQASMVAGAPTIDPLEITVQQAVKDGRGYYGVLSKEATSVDDVAGGTSVYYQDQTQSFDKLLSSRNQRAREGKRATVLLNEIAVQSQAAEIIADEDMLKKMKKQTEQSRRNEGIAVTYKIKGKITLPSKSDQQLVNIVNANVDASYTMLATPLLTDYVYLQGTVVNASDTIFLPGQSDMFRDGQFVGNGQMPLVTINETFDIGFGIDSQIKVVREFEDKKVDTLWGNRVDTNKYRIAIHNYKPVAVKLRLIDRIPYTENEELSISEFTTDTKLSDDKKYLRTQRNKGILRWDLNLKPNSSSEKATVVNYSYIVKYDGDYVIKPLASKN